MQVPGCCSSMKVHDVISNQLGGWHWKAYEGFKHLPNEKSNSLRVADNWLTYSSAVVRRKKTQLHWNKHSKVTWLMHLPFIASKHPEAYQHSKLKWDSRVIAFPGIFSRGRGHSSGLILIFPNVKDWKNSAQLAVDTRCFPSGVSTRVLMICCLANLTASWGLKSNSEVHIDLVLGFFYTKCDPDWMTWWPCMHCRDDTSYFQSGRTICTSFFKLFFTQNCFHI